MIKVVQAQMAGSGGVLFKPSEGGQISVGFGERVPSSLAGKLWELDTGSGKVGPKSASDIMAYAKGGSGTLTAYQVA